MRPPSSSGRFVLLWTMATIAVVCAFVVHLALRGKTMALGYELGRARAEQARLREVKRVLEVEIASYRTPERVDLVARSLLGMSEPTPDRIFQAGRTPSDAAGTQPVAPRPAPAEETR